MRGYACEIADRDSQRRVHIPSFSPIRDQMCAASCPVRGADNAAPDPCNSFCFSYVPLNRKTVIVVRNLPESAPPNFYQTMTISDHPA